MDLPQDMQQAKSSFSTRICSSQSAPRGPLTCPLHSLHYICFQFQRGQRPSVEHTTQKEQLANSIETCSCKAEQKQPTHPPGVFDFILKFFHSAIPSEDGVVDETIHLPHMREAVMYLLTCCNLTKLNCK